MQQECSFALKTKNKTFLALWWLVISKGLETPAGTQVRVRRVGVRVWNVWPHINPYLWCLWTFATSQTHYQQTTKIFLLNDHHHCDHPHCVTTIANHHCLGQLLFNRPLPLLYTPMTTTVWQHHITGPIHTLFWTTYLWWRWPGASINMPCCVDDDNTCRRLCPHCPRWATWHPSPSIHMRSRCCVAISDVATTGGWRIMNYSQGEPSHCPLALIFWHEKQVPCWLMTKQPHGTTMAWPCDCYCHVNWHVHYLCEV